MSILIKNARIVEDDKIENKDLFINKGLIEKIGKNLKIDSEIIIDAENKLLLAGGVDVHTHMSLDLGEYIAVDDFTTGTLAAGFGGTTTIVDHISFGEKDSLVSDMIDKYHKMADGKTYIDYSFHGAIQKTSEEVLEEMTSLYDKGIVSTKIYTTYGGKLDDKSMLKVLKMAKKTGTIVCVHCENDGMIDQLRDESLNKGLKDPIYHAKTRPSEAEAEAINRLIYLSEIAGFPKLYIVHTSSKLGLMEIKNARSRGVENLYCETCTQYLTLTEEKYETDRSQAIKYICAPPLRKNSDVKALWEGILDSTIDTIATDHCPFFYKEHKLPKKDDFYTCPGGLPGVEERMEVILTEGYKRGISFSKLSKLLSKNPSDIFGMGHKKGKIEEGYDADLVLIDEKSYIISQDNRHSNCDYTTYEGYKSSFKIDKVISKGKIIRDGDKFFGQLGDGAFIKRKF